MLCLLEPALERIEVLSETGGPSLYMVLGLDALVPLAVCGEGIVRLFSIIVELIASRNGVLLVDEIDNGLHYSVMPKLWKLLGALVKNHDVQIFATTHNDDMHVLRSRCLPVRRACSVSFASTSGGTAMSWLATARRR